jgi:hypothetical protein
MPKRNIKPVHGNDLAAEKLSDQVDSPGAGALELRPSALSADLGSESGASTPLSDGGRMPPAPPGGNPAASCRVSSQAVNIEINETRLFVVLHITQGAGDNRAIDVRAKRGEQSVEVRTSTPGRKKLAVISSLSGLASALVNLVPKLWPMLRDLFHRVLSTP